MAPYLTIIVMQVVLICGKTRQIIYPNFEYFRQLVLKNRLCSRRWCKLGPPSRAKSTRSPPPAPAPLLEASPPLPLLSSIRAMDSSLTGFQRIQLGRLFKVYGGCGTMAPPRSGAADQESFSSSLGGAILPGRGDRPDIGRSPDDASPPSGCRNPWTRWHLSLIHI